MAKTGQGQVVIATNKFRTAWMQATLDYGEDKDAELPEEERRRSWWSKDDIIQMCQWPGEWRDLRKVLTREFSLIPMIKGAPRRDMCWTFPTCSRDRQHVIVHTMAVHAGFSKYAANTIKNQIAPPDEQHALTAADRDEIKDTLVDRHIKIDQVIASIAKIQNELWIDDVAMLTDTRGRPQPEPVTEL